MFARCRQTNGILYIKQTSLLTLTRPREQTFSVHPKFR